MGIRHYHVTQSLPGYLPESDPYVTTDLDGAADYMASNLSDDADFLSESELDDDQEAATLAKGLAEIWRSESKSPEHGDIIAQLTDAKPRQGICEYVGNLAFEVTVCAEHDCLKYCPDGECRNVTAIYDDDHRCWVCGAAYVEWDSCGWFDSAA